MKLARISFCCFDTAVLSRTEVWTPNSTRRRRGNKSPTYSARLLRRCHRGGKSFLDLCARERSTILWSLAKSGSHSTAEWQLLRGARITSIAPLRSSIFTACEPWLMPLLSGSRLHVETIRS